jgi:hypothetical protein
MQNIWPYHQINRLLAKQIFCSTSHLLIEVNLTVFSMINDSKWLAKKRKPVKFQFFEMQNSKKVRLFYLYSIHGKNSAFDMSGPSIFYLALFVLPGRHVRPWQH